MSLFAVPDMTAEMHLLSNVREGFGPPPIDQLVTVSCFGSYMMEPMEILTNYYQGLFQSYGKDERSLGWTRQKQNIRFREIMRHVFLKKSRRQKTTLLDLGCGFGDLNLFLEREGYSDVDYYGLDIIPDFIQIAKDLNKHIEDHFYCSNFTDFALSNARTWDWIVESGFFGHRLYDTEDACYEYVRSVMSRSFSICNVGICFDFLSDRVDYRTSQQDFHAKPETILELAYNFSRNVMLDNSVMPFEFNITIWKDDSFSNKTVFSDYEENVI